MLGFALSLSEAPIELSPLPTLQWQMVMRPSVSGDAIISNLRLGSVSCIFSYDVSHGFFLGVPKESASETTPTAVKSPSSDT